jgi:hypothetical protein
MDIHTSKIELVKLILNTNNQTLIDKVYSIFKSEAKNQKPEFTHDQLEEIKLGLEQLEKGQGISLKDYLKKVS